MKTKISQDIGYNRILLEQVFKCSSCGYQLRMFGCSNSDCELSDEKGNDWLSEKFKKRNNNPTK